MSTFTPGPYEILDELDDDGDGSWHELTIYSEARGRFIEIARIVEAFDIPLDELRANGRLLKAAPKMLETLEAFVNSPRAQAALPCTCTPVMGTVCLMHTARAAIAAARGENNA